MHILQFFSKIIINALIIINTLINKITLKNAVIIIFFPELHEERVMY